jgi:hypothetical protein
MFRAMPKQFLSVAIFEQPRQATNASAQINAGHRAAV